MAALCVSDGGFALLIDSAIVDARAHGFAVLGGDSPVDGGAQRHMSGSGAERCEDVRQMRARGSHSRHWRQLNVLRAASSIGHRAQQLHNIFQSSAWRRCLLEVVALRMLMDTVIRDVSVSDCGGLQQRRGGRHAAGLRQSRAHVHL